MRNHWYRNGYRRVLLCASALMIFVPALASAQDNDCRGKFINHARFDKLDFMGADGGVIETANHKTGSDALMIQILGCDGTHYFLITPNGQKAMVNKLEVVLDGRLNLVPCDSKTVKQANSFNKSGNGFGDGALCVTPKS